jgi:hypothetical protein
MGCKATFLAELLLKNVLHVLIVPCKLIESVYIYKFTEGRKS